jgi:hypothetical protein
MGSLTDYRRHASLAVKGANMSRVNHHDFTCSSVAVFGAAVISTFVSAAEMPTGKSISSDEHFASISKSKKAVFASSFNDPSEYAEFLAGGSGHIGTVVFHDPDKKAARWEIPKGQLSIPIGSQFRPTFQPITDDIVSMQWEVYWDPRWQQGGKSFQIAWTPGGDDRLLEIQSSKIKTDPTIDSLVNNYRILHSFRTYGGGVKVGGNGNPEQLSSGEWRTRNVQPPLRAPIRQMTGVEHVCGGGTAYLVRPGQWVRYTVSWDLSAQPARLKMWIADESTDPTLVMADPGNHDSGFIYEPNADNRGVNQFWVELNSSSTASQIDCSTWVRNFVVWKGADIPRSGRPTK